MDDVLTFVELDRMFQEAGLILEKLPESAADGPLPRLGRIFPVPGGLLRSAAMKEDICQNRILVTEGKEACTQILEEILEGTVEAKFLDLLFCEGCINGPGFPNDLSAFARKELVASYVQSRLKAEGEDRHKADLRKHSRVSLQRNFSPDDQRLTTPSPDIIREILRRTNKVHPEDELNCGACGYASCQEKASAVYWGLAENEMCLPYLIDQLEENLSRLAQSHAELRETQQQLIQSEKMASVGQLAVEVAENGLEGLEKAKAGEFDLALIDLKMPQMDGMELLEHLNRLDPDLVKIVITGFATLETAVEAVQRGAYDYLAKPFTPGELRTRVNRGVEKRALLREAQKLREERERNLLELTTEKSRTQTIIQCMGDGLLVTNRDRQVVLCNPAGRRLLKVKRPLQVGDPLTSVAGCPEFVELVESAMNLKEGQEMTSREISPASPADPVLMANCAPVKDEKGQIMGVVTVLRDITALKELDKAKSTFVSLVSHELQAPLAAIEGYLDVILEGPGVEDRQKVQKILERCRERTSGLLALIQDLLAISRMQAGRIVRGKEKLQLSALLREVAELLRGAARERNIEINLELPEDLPPVSANREDLTRVFTNLVDNAIKYKGPGGKVFLRAKAVEGFLRVEIQDTGIGIAPPGEGKDLR